MHVHYLSDLQRAPLLSNLYIERTHMCIVLWFWAAPTIQSILTHQRYSWSSFSKFLARRLNNVQHTYLLGGFVVPLHFGSALSGLLLPAATGMCSCEGCKWVNALIDNTNIIFLIVARFVVYLFFVFRTTDWYCIYDYVPLRHPHSSLCKVFFIWSLKDKTSQPETDHLAIQSHSKQRDVYHARVYTELFLYISGRILPLLFCSVYIDEAPCAVDPFDVLRYLVYCTTVNFITVYCIWV